MPDTIIHDLATATRDLVYPGESDSPFMILDWSRSTGELADVVRGHVPAGVTISESSVADFFDPLKTADDADRFAALRRVLETGLKTVRVFRVSDGSAVVAIYLVGQTKSGGVAGVRTESVET